MKRIFLCLLLMLPLFGRAQTGIITTVAGNGTVGYSGDGGSALHASVPRPWGIAIDKYQNIFIVDDSNRIRKVDPFGYITTIAGDGIAGFSGDGGPAIAARLNGPIGLAVDNAGNIYVADELNRRIRKISTLGIITTVAGNGTSANTGDGSPATSVGINGIYSIAFDNAGNMYITCGGSIRKVNTSGIISKFAGNGTLGYSGDGGPATAAMIHSPFDIICDRWGNVIFADCFNHCIRKVTTSGIITTIAGNGSSGFSGDGGPATAATLFYPYSVAVDTIGNLYIADEDNQRIRKINTSGIISTIAGNGIHGYDGDGGVATSSRLNYPEFIRLDKYGTPYIADDLNHRVRKITYQPSIVADSFSVYATSSCDGLQFGVVTNAFNTGQHVKTYFNNGNYIDTATVVNGANGVTSFFIPLETSGSYTIKHVIYNGTTPVDSITYSRQYNSCQDISISFYYDDNTNCIKDSSEHTSFLPVTAEVKKNGITIDTISGTSGLYYTAYGLPSDVYSFHIIATPAGMSITCPITATISDTLYSAINIKKQFGFSCTTGPSFDIAEFSSLTAGRHLASGAILVNNSFCNAQSTTVAMNISPDYVYGSAYPPPTSVVGNTVTWDLGLLSSNVPKPPLICFTLTTPTPNIPSTWLAPGTLINSVIIANPRPGDIDTATNVIIRSDTVKSSYDPNAIDVMPSGYILNGTKLKYTIHFENTGNDTAHNIYVMDTLSDDVDPHSLRILTASAIMNTTKYYDATVNHTIVKFDFPGINLLDSSHHNQCDGMVIYTIKAKTGLTNGVSIPNHAGIFFDDNPVVMTDTAVNVISVIQGISTICEGDIDTLSILATGGNWTTSNGHATVSSAGIVTAISAGVDTIRYSISYANETVTTQKIITINPLPHAGTITGTPIVCEAAVTTLNNTISGGAWSSSTTAASVVSGVVSGSTAGTTIISYSVTNSCGTAIDTMLITVNPLPIAGTITGTPIVCESILTTLTNAAGGGVWSSSTTSATVAGGVVTGVSAGSSIISYSVTNSCGTAVDTMMVTVNPAPHAGTITGIPVVCVAAITTLANVTTGGTWSSSTTNATVAGGVVTGVMAGTAIISYSFTNSCGTDVDTMMVTINPLPNAGTITGIPIVCETAITTLNNIATSGTWISSTASATVSGGGVVSGVSAGSTIISYSVSNSCGTAIDTMMVTINPLPLAGTITGSPIVCEAATTILANTATGGTWSSSTTAANVVGGVVSGITTGTTIISYSVTNSCGTAIDTMMVTVNPLPLAGSIAGVSAMCVGSSQTIATTISGGSWTSSNTNATVVSGVVTGVAAGSVTITYAITNSCGTAITTLPVVIDTFPDAGIILGFASVCEGESITLTTTSYTAGIWSEITGNTSVTGGIVTGVNTGIDTVRFIVNNSCGTDIAEMVILVNPCNTEVDDLQMTYAPTVYPNPTTGSFVVDLLQPADNVTVTVMDVTGKILQIVKPTGSATQIPVSLSNVASGTYMIKVEADGITHRVKMVVW